MFIVQRLQCNKVLLKILNIYQSVISILHLMLRSAAVTVPLFMVTMFVRKSYEAH